MRSFKIIICFYLLATLLCIGEFSCSKPAELEEEVIHFDYQHLWYGNWLVEESSGIIHEGLFKKGDSPALVLAGPDPGRRRRGARGRARGRPLCVSEKALRHLGAAGPRPSPAGSRKGYR